MAVSIRDVAPVAHVPLVLGMLRTLDVARLIDTIIPPHPEHVLSCGRSVEALVLAILDGHHARVTPQRRRRRSCWRRLHKSRGYLLRLRGRCAAASWLAGTP